MTPVTFLLDFHAEFGRFVHTPLLSETSRTSFPSYGEFNLVISRTVTDGVFQFVYDSQYDYGEL